ncbi:MAG: hypothetical protein KGI38_08965 [Thaumarchaeota archaeon]|nr:hypothetical protein [Nitrososphaerota archaeon]
MIVRRLSLLGVPLGIALIGVGVTRTMSEFAGEVVFLGIFIAGCSAVSYTWLSLGRKAVFSGIAAGLVGAVVAWVAMRTMMRLVALTSGISPVLTFGGTSFILIASVILSILPAMGYLRFTKQSEPSFRKGLLYGLILTSIGGLPVLLLETGEITSIASQPLIPVAFILAVPVLFALTLEASLRAFGKYNRL